MNVYSSEYVYALLQKQGRRPAISSAVLSAALEILDSADGEDVIRNAREFFRSNAVMVPNGLEALPPAWLETLPDILWRTRKPHWKVLPYMIRETKIEDGVLCLKFAQEVRPKCLRPVWVTKPCAVPAIAESSKELNGFHAWRSENHISRGWAAACLSSGCRGSLLFEKKFLTTTTGLDYSLELFRQSAGGERS